MTELLTAAQMRTIERAAIESGEVTGLELMERAGQGVVEAIFEAWPALNAAPAAGGEGGAAPQPAASPRSISKKMKRKAVVLCGPGNNGGDGFVVARRLHALGWAVEVFLYGDAEKLPPDARANYQRWAEIGEVAGFLSAPKGFDDADLYIDALFGTGLVRPLSGDLLDWVVTRNADHRLAAKTVAVDVPSGLCSDSGRGLDSRCDTVLAGLTVSFHAMKIGHVLGHGPERSGKTVVKSIGLASGPPLCGTDRPSAPVSLVERPVGLGQKDVRSHKYAHGHALILTGGAGKTGAARLAARGALRIGAGLVTLGVPHEAQAEVAAQITALMMCEIGDAGALRQALADVRLNAICLGPGMGMERARELVPVVLGDEVEAPARRGVVLDADALTAYADAPEMLFAILHEACVLTPHAGEFARLFPDIAEKLNAVPTMGPAYSKVDAARAAAERAGCVVVFKGPDTVIATPDGQCAVSLAAYEREAPWLATAGSGDVLAGFITGLLARGVPPVQAAETAAWLHVETALAFGPGLIAEDLPEMLPDLLRKLEV